MFLQFLSEHGAAISAATGTLILAILTYLTSYIRARGREVELVEREQRQSHRRRDASLDRIEASVDDEKGSSGS